jgi:hypothetical protein
MTVELEAYQSRVARSRHWQAVAAAAAVAVVAAFAATSAGAGTAPAPRHALRQASRQQRQRPTRASRQPSSRGSKGGGKKHKHGPPRPPSASVSVDPQAVIGPLVPEDFLGLSFEASSLPDIAGYADNGDLVNLMRSLGPGVMRFGGFSVDNEAAWAPEGAAPAWAHTAITPQNLQGVAALARATGWRVLLAVTFGHYEPAAAAQEAQAAQSLLGSSLEAIAIGNEPDRYVPDLLRTSPWSFADYLTEASAYRSAIEAAAPGVPIAGPDASSAQSVLLWESEVAAAEHPALLTAHYYPLTRCELFAPKLGDLLSPVTRANESAILERLSAIALASKIPLRLDETNNVSCRGQPGVSDVFGSALWAVDYIARAMASGVAGLNFHDLIAEPETYSPLVAGDAQELASGALHANPEWYALLLSRSLLGEDPVRTDVAGAAGTLTASAFASPDGSVHVVLVDFAPSAARPLLVHLRVPSSLRSGTILRLSAPGLDSRVGVTLGGSAVSAEGTWSPLATLPQVSGGPGALALSMPAGSAALVTLYP